MADIQLKKQFKEFLDDPGVQLNHPNTDFIRLEDIFVFPDLFSDTQKFINSQALLNISPSKNRILIAGPEDSGKTTLMKVLFNHYLNNGLYPVYIDIYDARTTNFEDMNEKINHKYEDQYSKESIDVINSDDNRKKVILIDNFHKINDDVYVQSTILLGLFNNFHNVVLTEEVPFNVIDKVRLSVFSAELTKELSCYEIMEFSNELRMRLIEKWNSIGNSLDTNEDLTKSKQTKNFFDFIIGHDLAPSYPIFLLTILQIVHENEKFTVSESSYAQYYEFIILKSLSKSVGKEKTNNYMQYLSELSYLMFSKRNLAISHQDFSSFHEEQKRAISELPDEKNTIDILIKTETLSIDDSYCRFKYKYIYYYFIAKYLSQNIDLESVKEIIKELCSELSDDENANIVLFLTYLSKEAEVIDQILDSTKSIFSNIEPFSFEDSAVELGELIDELSKLGTKDKKLKELAAEYSFERIDKIPPHLLKDDDQDISIPLNPKELLSAKNTLKIYCQILRSNKSLKDQKISDLILDIYSAALKYLSAQIKIIDQIKEKLLKAYEKSSAGESSIETLAHEAYIRNELYNSYKEIIARQIRMLSLSIGNNLKESELKLENDLIVSLLEISSAQSEQISDETIKSYRNLIIDTDNALFIDLLNQILSYYIHIKPLSIGDEEKIKKLIENTTNEYGGSYLV